MTKLSHIPPLTSNVNNTMRKQTKAYRAFTKGKTMLLFVAFTLFVNFVEAQKCGDFQIQFLKTNVMACDDRADFYLVGEDGVTPPSNGSIHIDPVDAIGFTYSSYNYDPGLGILTFYDVAITSYKKFGTFTAILTWDGGECEISGKVVACCQDGLTDPLIVVDEDISDQTTATTLTGDVIFMGDVTFAANSYIFNSTRVYLGPDAQLLPQVNADFTFRTANLQPFCDCRWDRILLADGSNTLDMDGTTLKGALRGIHAATAVATNLEASNFLDNFVSLFIQNSTGTGPYNSSYYKVDGCTFDILSDPITVYCYDDQQSAVDMDAIVSTTCQGSYVMDVVVNNGSENVHIGHENYSMNKFKNTYSADKLFFSSNQTQTFVRNNEFGIGHFCGLAGARSFVGGTVAQMNIFTGTIVKIENSTAIMNSNSFTSGYLDFIDPDNTPVTSTSPAGCEVASNDFTGTSITIDGDNTNNVRFRIFDNYMYNSPPTIKEMPGSGSDIVIFHSNYLENNTTAALAIIDQCNFIMFANNHLEQLTFYTPADLATYNGVWWSDTRDATVSNNYLENCARGFSISGVNTTNVAGAGTQFTCNEFVNCFHPFYLSNPTLLNQGSSTSATDNCYNYFYSGSFPYGEQIAGSYSGTVGWYMQTPVSCNIPAPPFASCYCTETTTGLATNILLNTSSANSCTVPSSSKTTPTDLAVSKHHSFQYYPNPVATEINLMFDVPTSFIIYNLQGQQMYAQQSSLSSVVDVRQWPDGTYIIRTATKNGKFVVRK